MLSIDKQGARQAGGATATQGQGKPSQSTHQKKLDKKMNDKLERLQMIQDVNTMRAAMKSMESTIGEAIEKVSSAAHLCERNTCTGWI
jgi:hypothetical protein